MAYQKISAALSGAGPLPFETDAWDAIVNAVGIPSQEAKVVELVLRGMCDKQIGIALGVSVSTVRMYLRRACTRAGVTNRMQLVLHVIALIQKRNAPSG